MKTLLIILILFFFNACVNKHGVSASYYSECKEYYDLQGYYHKECGKDDVITYEEMGKEYQTIKKVLQEKITGEKEPPRGNVW